MVRRALDLFRDLGQALCVQPLRPHAPAGLFGDLVEHGVHGVDLGEHVPGQIVVCEHRLAGDRVYHDRLAELLLALLLGRAHETGYQFHVHPAEPVQGVHEGVVRVLDPVGSELVRALDPLREDVAFARELARGIADLRSREDALVAVVCALDAPEPLVLGIAQPAVPLRERVVLIAELRDLRGDGLVVWARPLECEEVACVVAQADHVAQPDAVRVGEGHRLDDLAVSVPDGPVFVGEVLVEVVSGFGACRGARVLGSLAEPRAQVAQADGLPAQLLGHQPADLLVRHAGGDIDRIAEPAEGDPLVADHVRSVGEDAVDGHSRSVGGGKPGRAHPWAVVDGRGRLVALAEEQDV